MVVTGFPWGGLPVVGREERGVAAWIDAIAAGSDGVLGGLGWAPAAGAGPAIDGDTVIAVGSGGETGWIVVPAGLARAIADRALDRPAELAAPRPPTPVERALAGLAIADAVTRVAPGATVEVLGGAPAAGVWSGGRVVARITVARPIAAELRVLAPIGAGGWPRVPGRDLDRLIAARGSRLPAVPCAVVATRGWVAPSRLGGLAVGDVVVVGPAAAQLQVGRGSIAAALDPGAGVATVTGRYAREATMTVTTTDPNPLLADDLRVALTIVVGEVEVSVRELLELAPGRTLALGRPVGGAVELRAGGRLVGRGELVVVDGDLGVRMIDVLSATPPAC